MNFKQFVNDYLTFSRNERKGITILIVIIFILAVANKVIFYFETPAKLDTSLLDSAHFMLNEKTELANLSSGTQSLFTFNPNTIDGNALDSLLVPREIKRNLLKFREKGGRFYSANDFRKIYGMNDSIFERVGPYLLFDSAENTKPLPKKQTEIFAFDPNKASDEDFIRLGFSEKQIRTIRNFQNKGGKFRSASDFFKIYGISETQKQSLAEYVVIEKEGKELVEKTERNYQVEINSADSVELKNLPGIGEKLSKRIVKYRDLLGGFHTIDQLKEVYGLPEETINGLEKMLLIDQGKIKKVDLNFADWNELARHPYIQKSRAQKIIQFRTKYGSFNNLSVLCDSMILNMEEYTRLKPYLKNKF
jgi:competence ComEA-like helix-hairpin-helix protein